MWALISGGLEPVSDGLKALTSCAGWGQVRRVAQDGGRARDLPQNVPPPIPVPVRQLGRQLIREPQNGVHT